MKYSKMIKLILILSIVIMLFSSCTNRVDIENDAFTELLNSHSDILDVNRSKIYHAAPSVCIELYLNKGLTNDHMERIDEAKDDFIEFLENNRENISDYIYDLDWFNTTIEFVIERNGTAESLYQLHFDGRLE